MVPKLNHPVIFGMPWFIELNPQIDWHNCSVRLDLDTKQCKIIAAHAANSFSGIYFYTADYFNQVLSNSKSSITAFAIQISHVEAPTS